MTARSHSRLHSRKKRLHARRRLAHTTDHVDAPTPQDLALLLVTRGLAPVSILGPIHHRTIPDTNERTIR